MKKWLKVIFRRRLRGLLLIRVGNIFQFQREGATNRQWERLTQYARDQQLAIVQVHDVEAIKAIQLGPDDRLVVRRGMVPRDLLLRLCEAKPGSIIEANPEDFMVLKGENHGLPERENPV